MRTGHSTAIAIRTTAGNGATFTGNGDDSVPNGYAAPDFCGQTPAQQVPALTLAEYSTGSSISTYPTQSMPANHGTYLFAPNPYVG